MDNNLLYIFIFLIMTGRYWKVSELGLVPRAGLEPATFRLGGGRSIQMSYRGQNLAGTAQSRKTLGYDVYCDFRVYTFDSTQINPLFNAVNRT